MSKLINKQFEHTTFETFGIDDIGYLSQTHSVIVTATMTDTPDS